MTKKPALGKGLSALIPASRPSAPEARPGTSVLMADLEHLEANRQQPRHRFDESVQSDRHVEVPGPAHLDHIVVARQLRREGRVGRMALHDAPDRLVDFRYAAG